MKEVYDKVKRRIWGELVTRARNTVIYPYLYKSYWSTLIFPIKGKEHDGEQYFSARPNPGAGIGHQIANWIAGYWWAKQFGLKFAHIPFSNPNWEDFLGFGHQDVLVDDLVKERRFKKVLLPLFDENSHQQITLIRNIISTYHKQQVVFICEQDQFYRDQFGVQEIIKQYFFSAPARRRDRLIFSKKYYNIAIHVRRGDIVVNNSGNNENLNMRFQQNNYFIKVLSSVLMHLKVRKPIMIYLFSQGEEKDFNDFKVFNDIHFCLEMSAMDSFLHMVFADLLITSKSSFSYKPALLSNGIKISPEKFWHGYPKEDKWILADENGSFDNQKLSGFHD